MRHTRNNHEYRQRARRITWIGLVSNVLLSAFKIVAGFLGSSQAVLADGVHSLSDTTTDVAVLFGIGLWSKPPDRSHPHGHGRIETVVTLSIGLLLMAVACGLAYRAVQTLQEADGRVPGWIALAAAVVSLLVKEGLYRWTLRVGRGLNSPAIVANARHHRSDAFSSLPVVVAVLSARMVPEWAFLDHLAGIVVSALIFRSGWRVLTPAIKELMDVGAPAYEVDRIREIAHSVDEIKEVHRVRTRYLGGGLNVDLHIRVDGDISVRAGHEISEVLKDALLEKGPGITDVVVHVEPVLPDGEECSE